MNQEMAISIQHLHRSFGTKSVLADMNMEVPRGETFAFLGRNGQGKTTTIRILLGLLDSEQGHIRVEGLDPARFTTEIRRRVGYLAEDQRMFGWMTVLEQIAFVRPFYPTWDDALARKLVRDFDLPLKTRVSALSKGQNVRLGLLLALAHRPELVILDDPTLGLDPIMRRDFMRDVIEHLQGRGVSVFFSSHLLYEIEPVADQVAILDSGRIICQAPTEQLRSSVRQFILSQEDYHKLGSLPNCLDFKPTARQVALVVEGADAARSVLQEAALPYEERELNLDEIFEAYVVGSHHTSREVEPCGAV